MAEQCNAKRARGSTIDDEKGKRIKKIAADETQMTACDRVFGISELAQMIFHEACICVDMESEDHHIYDAATWLEAKKTSMVAVHILLSCFYRVSRTWMGNVLAFESNYEWTAWPVDGKLRPPQLQQVAGQPNVPLQAHDIFFLLRLCDAFERSTGYSDEENADQCISLEWPTANGSDQFRLAVHATMLEPIRRLPVHSMFVTTPPVTILDVEVYSKSNFEIGADAWDPGPFDADGECCARGSRLATHHKESGFTIADLIDVATYEFKKRRCLTWILFKSMDHRKEEKLALLGI